MKVLELNARDFFNWIFKKIRNVENEENLEKVNCIINDIYNGCSPDLATISFFSIKWHDIAEKIEFCKNIGIPKEDLYEALEEFLLKKKRKDNV